MEGIFFQVGVGLQTNEKDCRFHLIGPKNGFEFAVVGDRLPNRFFGFVNHIERVVHRNQILEPGRRQVSAILQHRAQVVAHPHFAHQLLGTASDADFKIVHPSLHHQIAQFGIQVIGADVGGPVNVGHPSGEDFAQ